MGIQVNSEIIPTDKGHIRKHTIKSDYDCIAYDSGFAVEIGDSSCTVRAIQGDDEALMLRVDPNTNLLRPKTDIPTVKYIIKKGTNELETEVCY